MKALIFFLVAIVCFEFYSSFFYGFEVKIAVFTAYYLIILSLLLCVLYFLFFEFNTANIYIGLIRMCVFLVGGLLLSFSFYPLLDFYSFKPEGYYVTDWYSFRAERLNFEFFEQKWYGKWYGKFSFSVLFLIVFSLIFYFSNDEK
ncbi:hypothetical protein [Acinetobacter sp. 'aerobic (ED)']|uniref:hypothetical protein n=1 Tax=Acinetobacter sp. 'aerobic (ED)' TaxID=174230 RepID=UPI00192C3B2C|nr:hypothetical protein [Acinetobacter sp. 'aerobic (ED)']